MHIMGVNKAFCGFLILVLCVSGDNLFSQRQYASHTNGWYMYNGDHLFFNNWGVHIEAQYRRNNWITHPQQLLLRTGINYHFSPLVFVTAGYCFVKTYPYGNQPVRSTFPEHRIWQQLQFKNQHNVLEWISRFRMEQRFLALPALQTDGAFAPGNPIYTNRFRLLNRFSIPFKGKTIEDGSFYFSVYNEFFIGFGKNVALNLFDQNRAYAALGYKIKSAGRLEIGYLHQFILKSNGLQAESNHTLQIGFSSVIDFKRSP